MKNIVFFGAIVIILVVGYMGFFYNAPCDGIDKEFLACHVKLGGIGDTLGYLIFAVGGLCLAGLPERLGYDKLTGQEGSIGKWPFVFLGVTLLGMVIMYLL